MFTSLGIVLLLDYNTSEVKPPKVHVKIRIYLIYLDAEKTSYLYFTLYKINKEIKYIRLTLFWNNMLPVLTCYTLMHL